MSKLTKLILDPKRFLLDSRAYRRALLAALKTPRVALEPAARVDAGTPSELRARLLEELGRAVPALDVTDDGRQTIAVLREDGYLLSRWLHHLAGRGVGVVLQGAVNRTGRGTRETLDLADASLFAVDDLIRLLTRFSVTFAVADARTSVRVQIWEREGAQVVGPVKNTIARRIEHAPAAERGFFQAGALHHVSELLSHPLATHVELDVDVVYTWVNHRDPGWRALWTQTVGSEPEQEAGDTRGLDRYLNRDELKYSLRSVAQFAPWVRKIFVVTNCAPPPWLDVSHPKIAWIDHTEVLPVEGLPVFNSHAIESRLQHVPGLAEHFLYFNDDFFLTRPTSPSDFFLCTGMSRSFMEGHGSVNGAPDPQSPDYLNAARNGRRLIEETFSRSVTALHKHTPYALRRDVLLEMEERFSGPIGRTSRSRFRSIDDISTVSFLYHHYAFLTGKGIYASTDARLVKPQTPNYPLKLHEILVGADNPMTLCLNDGGGSGQVPYWDRYVVEFLHAYFPDPCAFER